VLNKLPNLKLISQTGKVSGNIDVDAAQELGIAIAEGIGDPTAPAELTWALIMAASRRIPNMPICCSKAYGKVLRSDRN
jgi:D-3-phosphoglycerate dehydrogenase